jgi:hypothetical protein
MSCHGVVTEADWAYAAGLYDGEGCVSIYNVRTKARKRPIALYPHWAIRVAVVNTSIEIIAFLFSTFGGSIDTHRKAGYRLSKKDSQQWYLSAKNDIEWFLNGILPFLRYKTREAELALEFLTGVIPNRKGIILTEFEVDRRARIVTAIRSLPGRGKRRIA